MLLNCIIVDYFILFCRDYYLVLFLLYFFSFCFIFLLVLLSPFKFYLILYCICFFMSYLSYCIYYQFISLCIPCNPLSQKCGERTNSFILLFLTVLYYNLTPHQGVLIQQKIPLKTQCFRSQHCQMISVILNLIS